MVRHKIYIPQGKYQWSRKGEEVPAASTGIDLYKEKKKQLLEKMQGAAGVVGDITQGIQDIGEKLGPVGTLVGGGINTAAKLAMMYSIYKKKKQMQGVDDRLMGTLDANAEQDALNEQNQAAMEEAYMAQQQDAANMASGRSARNTALLANGGYIPRDDDAEQTDPYSGVYNKMVPSYPNGGVSAETLLGVQMLGNAPLMGVGATGAALGGSVLADQIYKSIHEKSEDLDDEERKKRLYDTALGAGLFGFGAVGAGLGIANSYNDIRSYMHYQDQLAQQEAQAAQAQMPPTEHRPVAMGRASGGTVPRYYNGTRNAVRGLAGLGIMGTGIGLGYLGRKNLYSKLIGTGMALTGGAFFGKSMHNAWKKYIAHRDFAPTPAGALMSDQQNMGYSDLLDRHAPNGISAPLGTPNHSRTYGTYDYTPEQLDPANLQPTELPKIYDAQLKAKGINAADTGLTHFGQAALLAAEDPWQYVRPGFGAGKHLQGTKGINSSGAGSGISGFFNLSEGGKVPRYSYGSGATKIGLGTVGLGAGATLAGWPIDDESRFMRWLRRGLGGGLGALGLGGVYSGVKDIIAQRRLNNPIVPPAVIPPNPPPGGGPPPGAPPSSSSSSSTSSDESSDDGGDLQAPVEQPQVEQPPVEIVPTFDDDFHNNLPTLTLRQRQNLGEMFPQHQARRFLYLPTGGARPIKRPSARSMAKPLEMARWRRPEKLGLWPEEPHRVEGDIAWEGATPRDSKILQMRDTVHRSQQGITLRDREDRHQRANDPIKGKFNNIESVPSIPQHSFDEGYVPGFNDHLFAFNPPDHPMFGHKVFRDVSEKTDKTLKEQHKEFVKYRHRMGINSQDPYAPLGVGGVWDQNKSLDNRPFITGVSPAFYDNLSLGTGNFHRDDRYDDEAFQHDDPAVQRATDRQRNRELNRKFDRHRKRVDRGFDSSDYSGDENEEGQWGRFGPYEKLEPPKKYPSERGFKRGELEAVKLYEMRRRFTAMHPELVEQGLTPEEIWDRRGEITYPDRRPIMTKGPNKGKRVDPPWARKSKANPTRLPSFSSSDEEPFSDDFLADQPVTFTEFLRKPQPPPPRKIIRPPDEIKRYEIPSKNKSILRPIAGDYGSPYGYIEGIPDMNSNYSSSSSSSLNSFSDDSDGLAYGGSVPRYDRGGVLKNLSPTAENLISSPIFMGGGAAGLYELTNHDLPWWKRGLYGGIGLGVGALGAAGTVHSMMRPEPFRHAKFAGKYTGLPDYWEELAMKNYKNNENKLTPEQQLAQTKNWRDTLFSPEQIKSVDDKYNRFIGQTPYNDIRVKEGENMIRPVDVQLNRYWANPSADFDIIPFAKGGKINRYADGGEDDNEEQAIKEGAKGTFGSGTFNPDTWTPSQGNQFYQPHIQGAGYSFSDPHYGYGGPTDTNPNLQGGSSYDPRNLIRKYQHSTFRNGPGGYVLGNVLPFAYGLASPMGANVLNTIEGLGTGNTMQAAMGLYPLQGQVNNYITGKSVLNPSFNAIYDTFADNLNQWQIPGVLTKRKKGDYMGDIWNVYRAAGLAAPLLWDKRR